MITILIVAAIIYGFIKILISLSNGNKEKK